MAVNRIKPASAAPPPTSAARKASQRLCRANKNKVIAGIAMIACLKKPATTISKIGHSAPRVGSRRKNHTNATIMMARAGTCGSFIATYQSA